jgi:hypothetical protein
LALLRKKANNRGLYYSDSYIKLVLKRDSSPAIAPVFWSFLGVDYCIGSGKCFLLFPVGLILESQFKEGKLMDVGSVVNQGLIGMQKSQSSMLQSAQQIAQAGTTQRDNPQANDVVEPLINIKAQSQVFDSSAKVVKAADETIGTLLDVKA